jgi:alginate O-acetyltransferase complex protein AlgI
MVFSSLTFLFYFLPAVLILYFFAPKALRNFVLFITSLVFYAWGEPVYIVLMLFSTVVDYTFGWMAEACRGTKKAKLALIASVVINLALLCVFKYSDFIVFNLNALLGTGIPAPGLPLPIGISFYTFQTMSYTIDVYRGDAKAQKNIISFGAYVTLFPQLIAGPIVRFSTIAEQLEERHETPDLFSDGVRRFVAGLAKKVLLANSVGAVWDQFSALPSSGISVLGAWLGIIAFSFQIYFDFSGYSDMAIGLGKMLGFNFLENFDYPYISTSVTEFWRRWHISLGTWFREYVYIPLGGNRKGLFRQLANIAVVWLLTGIWHGASWNFAIWGIYYCALLILEKVFLLRILQKAPAAIGRAYTLFCVVTGWTIFAFDDFKEGLVYLGRMFGAGGIPLVDNRAIYGLFSNMLLLVILIIASTPLPGKLYAKAMGRLSAIPATAIWCCAIAGLFLASVAWLVDSSYNPFLYFRF